MTSKPPGVLGTAANPGYSADRTHTGLGTFRSPAPAGHHTASSLQEVEHRLAELAHRFSAAVGWHDKRSAAYKLLGQHSFTAGVVWGIGENFARTVFSAVELVEMLTLAEYWESKQNHTLMGQVRTNMFLTAMPGLNLSMMTMGHFWPGFDQKAKEAYEERGALIDAVRYAFANPKEFFGSLTKAQQVRYREFIAYKNEQSLSGNFHAGQLLGELLFDLFMVIDLVAGIAKLVAAVPRLARYAQDVGKLAREFRAAKQLDTKAAELAEPGSRMTQAEKDAAQARMRGGSDGTSAPTAPAAGESEPGFTRSEKGVYGEAQADNYMDEEGFQKLNGDLVQAGDDPLGPGIDGVWKNTNPPPDYVITEAKYGTSQLSTLKDGTKQMSDTWVEDRLDKAVGPTTAQAIVEAQAKGQVEKWLLHVDENGNVTKSLLDENGDVIPPSDDGS